MTVTLLLLLHLGAAVVAPSLVRRLGSRAFVPLALVPAATAGWAVTRLASAGSEEPYSERMSWVDDLGMDLVFRVDTLSWVMTLIVSGVGALVLLYCAHYVDTDGEDNVGLLASALVAFAVAAVLLLASIAGFVHAFTTPKDRIVS